MGGGKGVEIWIVIFKKKSLKKAIRSITERCLKMPLLYVCYDNVIGIFSTEHLWALLGFLNNKLHGLTHITVLTTWLLFESSEIGCLSHRCLRLPHCICEYRANYLDLALTHWTWSYTTNHQSKICLQQAVRWRLFLSWDSLFLDDLRSCQFDIQLASTSDNLRIFVCFCFR